MFITTGHHMGSTVVEKETPINVSKNLVVDIIHMLTVFPSTGKTVWKMRE